MGVKVDWLIENRAVYVHVWGTYSLEDLASSSEEVRTRVRAGTPLVHDIVDFRQMQQYPTNLKEIIPRADIFREANIGWAIILTNNRMVKFLSSRVTGIAKARFRTFDNWQDAMTFLSEADPTLAHIKDLPDPLAGA